MEKKSNADGVQTVSQLQTSAGKRPCLLIDEAGYLVLTRGLQAWLAVPEFTLGDLTNSGQIKTIVLRKAIGHKFHESDVQFLVQAGYGLGFEGEKDAYSIREIIGKSGILIPTQA